MDTRMEELKIEYPNLNDEHSLIYSPEDVFTKRKLKVARFFKTLKFRIQKITKTTNQKSLIDRYPYVLYHTKPKEIEGKEFIEDVQEINLNITPLNQLANAFQERGVTAKVYEEIKAEKQKQTAGVNLYVKYLPDYCDDDRLIKLFEKYGEITSAKVMTTIDGTSKGFGFVCFKTEEQSSKAMAEMNSQMIEKKPLYVALAQRKEVRFATLAKERQKDPSQRIHSMGSRGLPGPMEKSQMGYPQQHAQYDIPYGNQRQIRQPMMYPHNQCPAEMRGQWNPNIPPTTIGQFGHTSPVN
jgi:polyadenylate-binding protein